jgi:hypothetical protein
VLLELWFPLNPPTGIKSIKNKISKWLKVLSLALEKIPTLAYFGSIEES